MGQIPSSKASVKALAGTEIALNWGGMRENARFSTLTSFLKPFSGRGFLRLCVFLACLAPLRPVLAEFGSIVDLGFAGDLYMTNENANNGQGYVNLLVQNTWTGSQVWLDVGAGGLVGDTASSFVKAPQFYYRQGSEDSVHFTIGRARQTWSSLDDFWNLGVTQPIFMWNQAVPEQQGLTGVFVKIPVFEKKFSLTFFGSYLFIPSQGPTYELSNGQLTSSNPWFNDPVQLINLSGQQADLNYKINIPRIQNIVFRHSIGFQFGTEINKKDFTFNAFYLNKPRNELLLPFEAFLNLSTFNGDITVLPRVARHEVMGIDVGWNFSRAKTEVSWLRESSAYYQAPKDSTYPIMPEQNIFSLQQLFRLTPTQRLIFGYVKVDRRPTAVGGVFAGSDISTFQNRNRFEEAMRLEWQGLLFKSLSQYRVRSTISYNQSLIRDNLWLSADVNWSVYKGIELFTRCDIFGGTGEQIINVDLMSAYQNNDRCLLGGHYAF